MTCLVWIDGLGSEIQYLHPIPGSERHRLDTPIIVRFWDINPAQIKNITSMITVQTDSGRPLSGRTHIASDGKTILFYPDSPYKADQSIHARIRPILEESPGVLYDTSYSFSTISQESIVISTQAAPDETQEERGSPAPLEPSRSGAFQNPVVLNGISVPSDWPFVNITTNNNPYDGNIFICVREWEYYVMILDNSGAPLWYLKPSTACFHLNHQPNGLLTFCRNFGSYLALDGNYRVVGQYSVNGADGYVTDHHELDVQPDGHFFIIGHRVTTVDMSKYVTGGQTDARVEETIFQELSASHELLLEWRGWDHFDILDSDSEHPLTDHFISFPHMNAIDIDTDGHILLSSRRLNEITKINRYTGDIIWRLGGKNNQFTFLNDPLNGFKAQHDIRSLGAGRYTLFDNGNNRSPQISRAVEYAIDASAMTATLVWQFRDLPDRFSWAMGNVQRLPNGNTLINWASAEHPKITEVTPSGTKAFELNFRRWYSCYRVFKYDWQGVALTPYLVAEPRLNYITLIFNKFGDTDISHYQVFGSLNPYPTHLMATTTEPFAHLKNELTESGEYHFRVRAVSNSGAVSGYSNEVTVFHRIIQPGENMVINGDFSEEFYFWEWYVDDAARADREITPEGVFHYMIDNGGSLNWHVALRQPYIRLLQGETYQLEYDAWASQGRLFESEVRKALDPYTNFSQIGPVWLTPQPTHYTFQFLMTKPDESYARISLNAGASPFDVFIDNVSLKQVVEDSIPQADFETADTVGVRPHEVHYQDLSTGLITSWSWDFGDGETSAEQHPSHTYQTADTFNVSLTVTGPGGEDTMTRENYIRISDPPPVADFTADTTQGQWPFDVSFSDLSNGPVSTWLWDFGDGSTSTEQNPSHTYQDADTLNVTLIATGPGGADTLMRENYIKVSEPPPTANFTADTTRGLYPLNVQFSDLSTGPIFVWLWDFGDGNTSIEQNPSNTYSTIDSFTVALTAIGPGGVDVLTRLDYIVTSGLVPTAGFTADTTQGAVPFDVRFTDESIGLVDSWTWNFGDGQTSSIQHPVHSYVTVDTFTVRLIVLGQSGADTLVRPDYIIVTDPPPVAEFTADTTAGLRPLDVQFSDLSTGVITSWHWDFGDSTTSTEPNPSHVYQTADTFTVSLTAVGPGGSGGLTKEAYITVLEPPPVADFTADTTEGTIPFEVQFTDQSTGTISSWSWEFGDGQSSTEQNPSYTYQVVDTFSVSLTVSSPGGENTKIRDEYIITFYPSEVDGNGSQIPEKFALSQNYPNPFNASTTIHYAVPETSHIRLAVYNVRGECVYDLVNGQSSPGNYQTHFDASLLGSGLYFYRMESISNPSKNNILIIRKMIVLK